MRDGLGHGIMYHVAYIRLVDSHSKGDSGTQYINGPHGPLIVSSLSLLGIQLGMVIGYPYPIPSFSHHLFQFLKQYITPESFGLREMYSAIDSRILLSFLRT
jgi:hypothetical protein